MILTISNAWRGPIPGTASMAAVSVRGETAELAMERDEVIALPRPGQQLTIADLGVIEIGSRVPTPRGLVAFRCKVLTNKETDNA